MAQKKWAIIFAFLSLFLLGLSDNIRGPLFPEILIFFKLSSTEGSFSFAMTSGAAFLASFVSMYYLRRYSISSLLALGVFVLFLGMVIMGVSPSFTFFILGSFSLGLSFGFMGVAQNLLVSESIEPENQAKALSGLHAMYGFASFLSPIVATQTTVFFGNWRFAFISASALCFIFLCAMMFVRPLPAFSIIKKNMNDPESVQKKISKKTLFFICGVIGFYVVAEILVSTRLAQYMRNYFQMDLQQSSQYVTYFFLFLLSGRLFFAFKKINMPIKMQMNISLIAAVVFLVLGLYVHPFFLALVGLGMSPYYPLSIAYISEFTGEHKRIFITYAMSFQSLAVIAMHLGVGYLTDHWGLFYAFGVGLFALVLSSICLNLHPKKIIY